MFLYNQVLGVEVGWNVRDTDDCGKSVESVKSYQNRQIILNFFKLTFGFAWCSRNVSRAFLEMDYIASYEFGSLARIGIIHHMDFTYV